MKKTLVLFAALLTLSAIVSAQPQPPDTLWTRTFGGTYADEGKSVRQTSDGGFIIAGWTLSFGADDWDALLIKTDINGNASWTRTYRYPGSGWDWANSVQQTSDNGYIFTGETISFGGGNTANLFLAKTNSVGDTMWTRSFGGPLDEEGRCVRQTSDGGYIAVGWTGTDIGGMGGDVYLVKTDQNGNVLWTRTYGPTYEKGECVQQTSDGGYIITGWTESGAGYRDVYLIKTNSNGIMTWSRTFGGSGGDYGNSVQQTSDGGYIVAGWSDSFGPTGVYLIKTNANGDSLWTRILHGNYTCMGKSVKQTEEGGYIITGSCSLGGGNLLVMKTNSNGDTLWTENFGGTQNDEGYNIQLTNDSGYIITGWTYSYGSGLSDVYLIRLESEISPIEVNLTPHNPPIIIPPGGGSFLFDLNMTNNSQITYIIDAWTTITPPIGMEFSVLSRNNITLPAGWTMAKNNLTQFVPHTAPPGIYYYNAYLKDHNTWALLAEDSFPFTKLPGDGIAAHHQGWACYGWDEDEDSFFDLCPLTFALSSSPNPFNPSTTLSYSLPVAGDISLTIYDIQGREISTLYEGYRSAGTYEAIFDGSNLSSGFYFAILQAENFRQTQKLALIK